MKKITLVLVLMLMVIAVVLPATDLAAAFAQIPPPALPGSPDQAPLWGGAAAVTAALAFGVIRLYRQKK